MNSKKAITLLVLVSMLMALVPIVPVNALTVTLSAGNAAKGTTVKVTGANGDAPAGTAVELYWDDTTTAWNGVKGLMNSTTAKGSGNYEVWFDVPEATAGNHYVWIKLSTGEVKSAVFAVDEKVGLSATSGLRGDKIDVDLYGHAGEKDVAIVLVSGAATAIAAWPWTASTVDVTFTAAKTNYEGTLANAPIEPDSLTIDLDGAGAAHAAINIDKGDGSIDDGVADIDVVTAGAQTVSGTINYATGEYDITFSAAPGADFRLGYDGYVKDPDDFYVLSGSGTTSALGSATKRVTIPNENAGAEPANGPYSIQTLDAKGNTGLKAFAVGAVITVTPEEGAVGDMVTVKGRGFTQGGAATITKGAAPGGAADGIALTGVACMVEDYPAGGVAINNAGEFTMNIYIPEMPDEDDYVLTVSDGALFAAADFEVTTLSSITLTPDYGPQGQTVTISGENFVNKKDEVINVDLSGGVPTALPADVAIKTFKTNADGSFSGTFRVPAELDGTYDVKAYWPNTDLAGNNIETKETFRIGSVLVLLSEDEGPSGLTVTLSGNGFTAGKKWNATFGGDALFEDKDVAAGGLLKDGAAAAVFNVPQVEPGVYDITVLDVDTEIDITTQFTVTEATSFSIDPPTAPSGYNVTVSGMYWSESQVPDLEVVLYNASDEWDISNLMLGNNVAGGIVKKTGLPDGDHPGDWEAGWVVGNAAGDLDKGTYTLNITYGDWFKQFEFTVGDEHVATSARKATFRIGDTVSFNIEHSFGNVGAGKINGGTLKVYDPSGNLYWTSDALNNWVKSGMYFVVPVAEQTSNNNPMVLFDDAPLGTWTYKWLQNNAAGDGSTIKEGSFAVEAAAEEVINDAVADLANQLDVLSTDLTGVTAEFDDVKSDIAGVESAVADAISAAEAAAEAVTAVAATANTASEAAADAAEAANAARDAASGLTTLVYGAIGAALVAALAAIVSLMQISRRIAG